jgi:hypothetical protein
MIVRLRPKYTDEELAQVYQTPHSHTRWKDHRIRVNTTIATAKWFEDANSVADLSCGDAAIVNALDIETKFLGDYAPGYEYTGPLEETIEKIPDVDLYICSETIEHLDDPLAGLRQIRAKTKYLVLSTPNGEDNDDNPEHYWGWDDDGVRSMLLTAGFNPVVYQELNFTQPQYCYNYQIWGCE